MKTTITLLIILVFAFCAFGQVRRTPIKPKTTTTPEAKTEAPEAKPLQKVVVEKTNGDKLTGLFVSGNADSVTIEISGTKVPIGFTEIKAMWVGDAKPEPPVIQAPTINYAGEAIKSLKKLSAATDVGVNFQDYGRRVIDVKAEVEELLLNIADEFIKNEIKSAMEAYVDAGSAWNFTVQNRGVLFIDFEPAITLRPKYNLPTSRLGSMTLISKEAALSTIWAKAKAHIENAQKGKPE
jgi:hypothetical protein